MKIENNNLIIDEPLSDENVEELIIALKQKEIQIVKIDNDEVSSGIVQALWCSGKKIETESLFLSKFFENVKVVS
jgi:hypothetical protein